MAKKKKSKKEDKIPIMKIPVKLTKVGNSQGFVIPKTALIMINGDKEFTLEVFINGLVIKPKKKPREGWEESFRESS